MPPQKNVTQGWSACGCGREHAITNKEQDDQWLWYVWTGGQMAWLRQSPLMTQTSVIRKLILSQQPIKWAGFFQGSAMCPPVHSPHKHHPAWGPSHQPCHLVAGGKPQQMTSTCPQPSRTSQTCDCHGGEPLETFVIDPKLWPCAFREWSFGANTFHYAGIVCIYKNINRTTYTCTENISIRQTHQWAVLILKALAASRGMLFKDEHAKTLAGITLSIKMLNIIFPACRLRWLAGFPSFSGRILNYPEVPHAV